ncbi:MAG: NmrA/HSCARG family protein [Pseudomonadota bacterium]
MKNSLLLLLTAIVTIGCGGGQKYASNTKLERTILVTGATGTQGGAVARELLDRGYRVRGLTRNNKSDRANALAEIGVEIVKGNFENRVSLVAAMNGVYGVFAMTDFWEHGYEKEVQHGLKLVEAALATGVQHFVYSSVAGADANTGIPHFESKAEIEARIRGSGINFSIVRPVEFMDNVRYHRDRILSGEYLDPRHSSRNHQWIAASDIGFFVGEAFDNPDEWAEQTLEIAGDQISIGEFVDSLSRIVGSEVKHRQLNWEDYEEQNGHEMAQMLRWFDAQGYDADTTALRTRYPNLLTYEQYLRSLDWN